MNVQKTELLRGLAVGCVVAASIAGIGTSAHGQIVATQMKEDPNTGDIYRETTRQVVRPVVDERIETQTYYRPQTVKETRPEYRTSYSPVTQIHWMPYLEGRWNPFRQPTVAYRQVPVTHWQARNEVVDRTTYSTQYVAEKRDVPHRITRYETNYEKDLQLVARGNDRPQVGSDVASRLVPMNNNASSLASVPVNRASVSNTPAAMVASNTVGRATSAPPMRNTTQSGMRTNVLMPSDPYAAPGASTPSTIATVPAFSLYR
ncbi:hypothetical protein [Rhodopirellula sp. MGV]|uniref:hypothetical protein n=1 Tax=Rhodopirellula sp. MGV TaxID=2023130 RepID=UPI000B96C659|nr:hypothetical protein [Rhodopirellula sp. MGV]PNY36665.1 hypothetical protein C2E31_12545 [Rhodopirellula baltica]